MRDSLDQTTAPAPSGSDLCLPCGLCCSGLLHSHAILAAGELDQARRLGLHPVAQEGGYSFPLPCPLYLDNGSGCPTYRDRPAVCHSHQCELLAQHLAGTMRLAEGVALARQIKELASAIQGRLGARDPGKRLWQQAEEYRQEGELGGEGCQLGHAELLQEVARLKALCRQHFNPRDLGKDEPATE